MCVMDEFIRGWSSLPARNTICGLPARSQAHTQLHIFGHVLWGTFMSVHQFYLCKNKFKDLQMQPLLSVKVENILQMRTTCSSFWKVMDTFMQTNEIRTTALSVCSSFAISTDWDILLYLQMDIKLGYIKSKSWICAMWITEN